jgi:hypothetical protein
LWPLRSDRGVCVRVPGANHHGVVLNSSSYLLCSSK